MPIRTVILDFDGTCTDAEREARGFVTGYKRALAGLLGRADVEAAWAEAEARILAEPARFGMRIGGALVAPAVDLYLMATAISNLLAPDLPDAETERLFKENYRYTTTAFKPGARALVEALLASGADLHVVTNSDTGRVSAKLDALAPRGRAAVRVHGDARKFLVAEPVRHAHSARFAGVPAVHRVPGWERPIHPRRGHYFDVLASIWEASGSGPEETLVIGDVFELDLVLPGTLGCRLHLVPGARSLDYERRGVEAFGGSHHPALERALDALG